MTERVVVSEADVDRLIDVVGRQRLSKRFQREVFKWQIETALTSMQPPLKEQLMSMFADRKQLVDRIPKSSEDLLLQLQSAVSGGIEVEDRWKGLFGTDQLTFPMVLTALEMLSEYGRIEIETFSEADRLTRRIVRSAKNYVMDLKRIFEQNFNCRAAVHNFDQVGGPFVEFVLLVMNNLNPDKSNPIARATIRTVLNRAKIEARGLKLLSNKGRD